MLIIGGITILILGINIGFVMGGIWVAHLTDSIYKSEPPSMRPDFKPESTPENFLLKPIPEKYKEGSIPWSKYFTDAPWTDMRA